MDQLESSARMVALFRKALSIEEDTVRRLEVGLKEDAALVRTIAGLPNKTRHPIMVPFGRMAFFAGELVHTNELLVHLGDQLYVERSAKQAGEILKRKGEVHGRNLEAVREKVAGLRERIEVAQGLAEMDSGDFLEIREEYSDDVAGSEVAPRPQQAGNAESETVLAASAEKAGPQGRIEGTDVDPDFEELMGRLAELEAAEERAAQGMAEAEDGIILQSDRFTGTEHGSVSMGNTGALQDKEDKSKANTGWGGEAESKAEGRSVGSGVGSKQKKVRFAEELEQMGSQSGGPSDVNRDALVAGDGTESRKGAGTARPIVGRVFDRASAGLAGDKTWKIAEVGSEDDTKSEAKEGTGDLPAKAASGGESEEGSLGSEELGEDEEEADRRFFEELAAAEEGPVSEDEGTEEEEGRSGDDEDDEWWGASLETGRQVSADIQQWLARRAQAGSAPEEGRASTSAYARDMALESARTRLRQRAEQVHRLQSQGMGRSGGTGDDERSEERAGLEFPLGQNGGATGSEGGQGADLPERVNEIPQRPVHESKHQIEKEAAFQRFLSEDFAPKAAGPSEEVAKREARPERNTAAVGRVVEKEEPPRTATSLATLKEPVPSSLQEKPISRFKRERQRRAGGV